MTKKLEDLLNLPPNTKKMGASEPEDLEVPKTVDKSVNVSLRTIDEFDKISAALPLVKDLGDKSDQELDDLAQKATEAYNDLMDLGMNVEVRYGVRMFEVAATMLKNAVDAKAVKLDKKLKMIDLQLKKAKLDQDSGADEPGSLVEGKGVIVSDRNSLIQKLKNIDK
jgi:hypothetical protein